MPNLYFMHIDFRFTVILVCLKYASRNLYSRIALLTSIPVRDAAVQIEIFAAIEEGIAVKEDLQTSRGPPLVLLNVALQIPRRDTRLESLKTTNQKCGTSGKTKDKFQAISSIFWVPFVIRYQTPL